MRRPKMLYTFVLVLMSLIIVDDIQAQRRSSSSRRTTRSSSDDRRRTTDDRRRTQEKEKLAERWLAIHLGNVGFNGGFSLSTKFSYGFEFYDRFSIGANARIFYNFLNIRNAPDLHLVDYGLGPQVRIKVIDEFYLIGEYNYNSIDGVNSRNNLWSAYAGAGYKSGIGAWNYGAHILYPFQEEVRDIQQGIEFWIDFNYNF